ncbi:23S rRNA (guanosine(2251)-2'-O)-methyltransferase RlmB [Bounagaea algeriensis]
MAGNDRRRGATNKKKKGMVVGSGGQKNKQINKGRKPIPKAENRTNHPAQKRKQARIAAEREREQRREKKQNAPEIIAGRNPVVECLRAGVPATGVFVAYGIDTDDRVTEAVESARTHGIAVVDAPRAELDKLTGGANHQGLALKVPAYNYAEPEDVLEVAQNSGMAPLIVVLDGVTDPRNLGAVVRSAAAFGAHGVILPQRRSAGMTAVAWRASAGTAAQLPVARCVNLTRTLKDLQQAGLMSVGLDADADISSDELELATEPLVVVVGSEGRGLSRLVRETCDQTVSIPMAGNVESLNASVASGVVLAEVARRRRLHR